MVTSCRDEPHRCDVELVAWIGEAMPLQLAVPIWLARSKADNKPSTYDHKVLTAKDHIVPTFGKLRLDQVTFDRVDDWRVGLDGKLKPASIARLLNEFHSLMNLARKRRHILELPEWPQQGAPLPRPKFLTFEELDRLIAAAEPMDPWKAMVIVAARTGLRHGELTALRWEDVDLDGGKLFVVENYVNGITGTPKSGKDREVPLSNDAIKALRALTRHQRGPLVFCTNTGAHLEPWVTDAALTRACRAAGMMPVGWHRLRHTFASHLAMRGVSIMTIRELMGHANIKMTLRYAFLMPEVRRDAVLLLDQAAPVKTKEEPKKRRKRKEAADDNDDND